MKTADLFLNHRVQFEMKRCLAGPDAAVAVRSRVPSLQPGDAPRPEAREHSGDQSGPGEAGRLWPGQDLQLPHGAHSRGKDFSETSPSLSLYSQQSCHYHVFINAFIYS